jgi:hypothetical protein
VPGLPGVSQIDRYLSVFHAACGPGVLALSSHRHGALFDIAGLIDHQHRARITEVFRDIVAQVIAHSIGVPYRASQQVLQAIRAGLPGVLGNRLTILAG